VGSVVRRFFQDRRIDTAIGGARGGRPTNSSELAAQDTSGAIVLIGANTPRVPPLPPLGFSSPKQRGRSILADGFRNNLVPADLALARHFGGASVNRGYGYRNRRLR
jgi:hypothetical protein